MIILPYLQVGLPNVTLGYRGQLRADGTTVTQTFFGATTGYGKKPFRILAAFAGRSSANRVLSSLTCNGQAMTMLVKSDNVHTPICLALSNEMTNDNAVLTFVASLSGTTTYKSGLVVYRLESLKTTPEYVTASSYGGATDPAPVSMDFKSGGAHFAISMCEGLASSPYFIEGSVHVNGKWFGPRISILVMNDSGSSQYAALLETHQYGDGNSPAVAWEAPLSATVTPSFSGGTGRNFVAVSIR